MPLIPFRRSLLTAAAIWLGLTDPVHRAALAQTLPSSTTAPTARQVVVHIVGDHPNARVWLIKAGYGLFVTDQKITGDEECLKSAPDADGIVRFTLPSTDADSAYLLFALTDTGCGFANPGDSELRVQLWTSVSGIAHVGRSPEPGRKITAIATYPESYSVGDPIVFLQSNAVTNADGRYQVDHVPSLPVDIAFVNPRMSMPSWILPAASDRIRHIDIGAVGPRLKARVTLPPGLTSWDDIVLDDASRVDNLEYEATMQPRRPPADVVAQGILAEADWARRYDSSEEAKQRRKLMDELRPRTWQTVFPITPGSKGELTVGYGIPPGNYVIFGNVRRKIVDGENKRHIVVGTFERKFTVRPDDDRDFIDLGDIESVAAGDAAIGDAAPPLVVPSLAGGNLDLSNFRGRYILLDFWATWCGPCVGEMLHLKSLYDRLHATGNVEFVSVSFDDTPDKPIDFTAKHGILWHQAIAGKWGDRSPEIKAMTDRYSVRGIPDVLLIDPTGKVVARGHRDEAVNALEAVLRSSPPISLSTRPAQ